MPTNKSKKTMAARPATKGSAKRPETSTTTFDDAEKNVLNQMYSVTEHWQSDMKFFYDEVLFFKNLVDKYIFMNLLQESNIASSQKTTAELLKLDNQQVNLARKLEEHNKHLVSLIENPFSHSMQECKDEHVMLETAIADFVNNFRSAKKNIFRLAETAINSQKSKHLLKGQ